MNEKENVRESMKRIMAKKSLGASKLDENSGIMSIPITVQPLADLNIVKKTPKPLPVDSSHIEVEQAKVRLTKILGEIGHDVPLRVQRSNSLAMLEIRRQSSFETRRPQQPLRTKPSIIEDIRIVRKLGQGSFGSVWKAQNRKTGELMALKKVIGKSFHEQTKFLKEAEILQMANHPNVLRFVGLFIKKGKFSEDITEIPETVALTSLNQTVSIYLCTEYCKGGDLRRFLLNKELIDIPWEVRVRLCLDVARGLMHLHGQNIVHRDVKAENVLLKPIAKFDWRMMDQKILKFSNKTKRREKKTRKNGGFGFKLGDEDSVRIDSKKPFQLLKRKIAPHIKERARKNESSSFASTGSSDCDSDDTDYKENPDKRKEHLLNSRAILGDVGLAKMFKASTAGLEVKEAHIRQNNERITIRGTPWTMAPELIFNKNNYTTSSDIYSLGIVFLEISLRVPPEPTHLPRNNIDLTPDYEKIKSMPIEPFKEVSQTYGETCPEAFFQLASRCCNIDPLERPTAKVCCKELGEILRKYRVLNL